MKIIENDKISIELDSNNGRIENIFLNESPWSGYSGRLMVTDELEGRIFKDDVSCFKTEILDEIKGNKIVFEKRFDRAEFSVRETWNAFEDCISWRVELVLDKGAPGRTIKISQLVPYPYPAYKLNVWSANEKFPCALEKVGGLQLGYGDACYGTVIPAVSIYSKGSNRGITIAKPFERKTARLSFGFNDYHSCGMEVISSNLMLRENRPAVMEILIHPHEGCWRPGLAWLYEKHRSYFDPPNSRVHNLEGGFMITNPFTDKEFIESVGKYDVKWAEIHNHFPHYGNYAPDEKDWDTVIKHDYPELPPPSTQVSRELINSHIDSLHENNIKGLLYFQCTGDAYIPYAEEHFPDSIARDCGGKIIPTWKECCFVNASPGTSFNKHIDRQIDKFIADYPDIDGVFLDQVCYQAIDTVHDDGISGYNNKPASMFGYSYRETLNKLSDILHKKGKLIWGNGPFDIEVQKNIDGIMAEGTSGISETYKYLCLTKPLLVHTYPDKAENVETMFKYCLLSGASFSIGASSKLPVPDKISDEVQRLFDAYIPLLEKLYGRTWILEPEPLQIPSAYEGNIFRGKNRHSIIVTLIRTSYGLNAKNNSNEVKIRLNDINVFSEASMLSTESNKLQLLDMKKADGIISINIKENFAASVIILK